jgi:hypothetical protein
LLANAGLLTAPTGRASICVGAGAAIGSLLNKCDASQCAPAAVAAFDVIIQRASTQGESDAAAESLAWIVRCMTRHPVCFDVQCISHASEG